MNWNAGDFEELGAGAESAMAAIGEEMKILTARARAHRAGLEKTELSMARLQAAVRHLLEGPHTVGVDFNLRDSLVQCSKELDLRLDVDFQDGCPQWVHGDPGLLKQLLAFLWESASNEKLLRMKVGALDECREGLFFVFDIEHSARFETPLVRALVDLLKARLFNRGDSEIIFEVPLGLATKPSCELDCELGEQNSLLGSRVLLADRGNVRHLPIWFDHLGLQCCRQSSPRDVLLQLGRCDYDFVVLDLSLGGFATVADVCDHFEPRRLVVTTRRGERGDARRCMDLGVGAYLVHPLMVEDAFLAFYLISSGHSALLTRHSLREIREHVQK